MAPLLGPIPCRCYRNAQRCPQQGPQTTSHRRQNRGCRTRDGNPGLPSYPRITTPPTNHRRRVVCQPPELEVRDIGDLTMEQFRGIFRLTYTGDAHLVLRTKVQVCDVPNLISAILPPPTPSSTNVRFSLMSAAG